MSNAVIRNCGILNCNFTKTKLDSTKGWENDFSFSTFEEASLIGADISTSHIVECNFTSADLSSAKILRNQIYGSTFANANLRHAKTHQSTFNLVVFINSNVEDVDFSDAFFNGYSMGLLKQAKNLDLSSRHEAIKRGEGNDWEI